MKILMAASEAYPYCKTGGLGDVTGALSQIFAEDEKNEVVLFIPRYKTLNLGSFSPKSVPGSFVVPVNGKHKRVSLSKASRGRLSVYFVDNKQYFNRDGVYRDSYGDFGDNDERFIFFSRAVLEGAKFIDFKPDIVHCHDWQTGLVPAYLKTVYSSDAFYTFASSVLTVHNIAYQGIFPADAMNKAGISFADFTADKFEFYGNMNFLKAGLVYADRITTVSPSYAEEIKNRYGFGYRLEGLLRARSNVLSGVLNGIDSGIWNPADDPFLKKKYCAKNFRAGKEANKTALQKELGLTQDKNKILAGIVSRMDYQKGLDIILRTATEFSDKIQFVVLGSGDEWLSEGFRLLAAQYPQRFSFSRNFDEPLAHRIYAASDIFLMPSRFEPCGLSQMIAMRYGALPVVTNTGGLRDTVTKDKNGFVIDGAEDDKMRSVLGHIVSMYKWKETWGNMVSDAMGGDYSWSRSSKSYMDIYGRLIEEKNRMAF